MPIDEAMQERLYGFTPLFPMPDDARFRMLVHRTDPRGHSLYAYIERQRRCCVIGYQDASTREEMLIGFDHGKTDVRTRFTGDKSSIDGLLGHIPYFIDVLGLKGDHLAFRDILDEHYTSLTN